MDKQTVSVERLGIRLEITEAEAFDLLAALRATFGWAGTEFTRADIETTIDRELTEDEWEKIQNEEMWYSRLGEITTEQGWWAIDQIVSDL